MIIYGDALTEALLIFSILLFCVGMALAGFGVWALFIRSDDTEDEPQPETAAEEFVPPPWHPEHPDQYASEWARRHFEDMCIERDAKRAAHRRQP